MRVHIIANPVSGGGRGERLAEALRVALDHLGVAAELERTTGAGHARQAAQRTDADCVAVVGGDGTVNEVLNGLADHGVTMAILPSGTANVVARELRIPRDAAVVAQCIAERRSRPLDVGLCGERRFLLGAGAGLDAAVVREVSARRGARSSLLKWVGPSIATILRYGFPPIRATVDGAVVSESAQYAIVGNCRYSAGVFPITPKALPDDGLLDVCLLHGLTPLRLLGLLASVWRPGFVDRKDVIYLQGRDVVFEPAGEEPAPLQVDGDPAGELPAHFGILPRAVRIVTPHQK
jgi:YegS/Rv2252/BmrU family lipid kinase